MKKSILTIITFFFIGSCLSINPYNEPEGKGAYLKNRIEYKGKARYSYFFVSAGKKGFSPGLITPEGKAIYKILIAYRHTLLNGELIDSYLDLINSVKGDDFPQGKSIDSCFDSVINRFNALFKPPFCA